MQTAARCRQITHLDERWYTQLQSHVIPGAPVCRWPAAALGAAAAAALAMGDEASIGGGAAAGGGGGVVEISWLGLGLASALILVQGAVSAR